MQNFPKIGIVYLSFHSEPYLDDVVSSLKKITYPKNRVEFIIVDNPHPQHGSSVRYINENLIPLSGFELPVITLLPQTTNLGFAGGNNVGINKALELGCDYVFLHNNDGFLATNSLEPIVEAMEKDKTIGAAQSLMLLYPDTNLVNSAGNSYHYLGIGYCGNFRTPFNQLAIAPVVDSGYVSGAALMLRADLLKQYGALDADYYLYHEDLEYSFRLKSLGYRAVVVRDSIFYHKYNFSRNNVKYYYIERNRPGLLLTYYKWPTLFLLLPVIIFWELGMIFFSLTNGWFNTKLKTYGYWLKSSTWKLWLGKRQVIQKHRTVSDGRLLANVVGRVNFNEASVNTPLLRYVANPILAAYWWVANKIIFW